MLKPYFADLHIHIGRDLHHKPVKITASKNLTLTHILEEATYRKGIDMIGIIDCQSPTVQIELANLLSDQKAVALADGGIRYEDTTLILGAEIEVYDDHCLGPVHVLTYFPNLETMQQFTAWLRTKMKNIYLSTQRYYGTMHELQYKVKELEGLFIPAHIFTPFKSVYGKGVDCSFTEIFNPTLIDAMELGLSADASMADQLKELHDFTFVTNSDSHSLRKIGREYMKLSLEEATFSELRQALHHQNGRKICANYGLNPYLGKYYQTVCQACGSKGTYGDKHCESCNKNKVVNGVNDRILHLKDTDLKQERPPYYYQVPLDFLPGLGPKTYEKLLDHFQTEMQIIHEVPYDALKEVVGEKIATQIIALRSGKLVIEAGGGGKYGKVKK